VSRVIGRLDELGLIVRQANAADLRVTFVSLTPEGKATHKRVKEQKGQVIADGLDRLDDSDQASIMAALPALEALSGALAPRPRPSAADQPS
jgi:DNA-binding MarR family transcriptional regulator